MLKTAIRAKLNAFSDPNYKSFQSSLSKDLDPDTILGIRMPLLRSFCRTLSSEEKEYLLTSQDPGCYEEIVLKILLINEESDCFALMEKLEQLRPLLSSWTLTDLIAPAVLKQCTAEEKDLLFERIQTWLSSSGIYTKRMGLVLLLKYYLDPVWAQKVSRCIPSIDCSQEMVSKACAWLVCEGIIQSPDCFLPLLRQQVLDPRTHAKTIQKCIDSFRISSELKKTLRSYRRMKTQSKQRTGKRTGRTENSLF